MLSPLNSPFALRAFCKISPICLFILVFLSIITVKSYSTYNLRYGFVLVLVEKVDQWIIYAAGCCNNVVYVELSLGTDVENMKVFKG